MQGSGSRVREGHHHKGTTNGGKGEEKKNHSDKEMEEFSGVQCPAFSVNMMLIVTCNPIHFHHCSVFYVRTQRCP